MILRKRMSPSVIRRIGLLSLAAGILANWYFQRHAHWSSGWTDGVYGFLYGVGIGGLGLSVWMDRRRSEPR